MPYVLVGNCVHKQNADGKAGDVVPGGCHKSEEEAKAHMRALYANVKNSEIVDFSMAITKASYDKFNATPRHWRAVDSDTDSDLYDEQMSKELFEDFTSRINNHTPVPEAFKSVICEDSWCGDMPYLSIAHYKAGEGAKNVPGKVEAIYVDGNRLKSKGTLYDTELGRKVFDSLCEDAIKQKSGEQDHLPVRISIGFLDLQHKHTAKQGGQEFIFTRSQVGQICPLCEQGIGGKIYLKGQLVHLALTRVPVNPRTEMVAEKSMDILTKKDDAKSIVKELADELDERSLAEGTLVVRADSEASTIGSLPSPDDDIFKACYDPNNDTYNQECLNKTLVANMVALRKQMTPVKSQTDVVEDAKRKDVTPADKKAAEKEYGKVKFADETNKKYPIDTEEHIRAAWNYIHQAKNAAKYPDGGKAIKGKIVAAWKRVIGGEPPSVEKSLLEASMAGDTVEKMNLGGENVEEKKFNYMGINGDGNNVTNDPLPEKAKADKEDMEDEKDGGDDEEAEGEKPMKKKSALDAEYAQLKSLLEQGATTEEINAKFASFASVAEKSYAPKQANVNESELVGVIKSLADTVKSLQIDIAQIKAQGQVQRATVGQIPAPRSLQLKPADLLMKSQSQSNQPVKKLSQIEMLARKSTGAYVPPEQ